jgi:hypothetical protein
MTTFAWRPMAGISSCHSFTSGEGGASALVGLAVGTGVGDGGAVVGSGDAADGEAIRGSGVAVTAANGGRSSDGVGVGSDVGGSVGRASTGTDGMARTPGAARDGNRLPCVWSIVRAVDP